MAPCQSNTKSAWLYRGTSDNPAPITDEEADKILMRVKKPLINLNLKFV